METYFSKVSPWYLVSKPSKFFREVLLGLLLVLAVGWLVQYHWKRRRLYYLASKIHGPRAYPLIGSALLFAGDTQAILENVYQCAEKFSSPCKVWLAHRLYFVISSPSHFETVMTKCLQKDDSYKFVESMAGHGLVTAPLNIWKKHRKLISPTFNQKVLDSFVDTFAEQSQIFVDVLRPFLGQPVQVHKYLDHFTLEIICESAMGIKMNLQRSDSAFGHAINNILQISFKRMFNVFLHPDFIYNLTPMSKKCSDSVEVVHKLTSSVVKTKREAFRNQQKDVILGDVKRKTFLENLIEASDGDNFSDKELIDETVTMLTAGSDTSSSTIGFILTMLGMHQGVQDLVYDEVIDVLGQEGQILYSDLPHLDYTERAIKEAMRLFPIGPLIVRAVEEDLDIGCATLPVGCSCVLMILHVHRNPKIWPDPLRFDPDRFLPENCEGRHPFAYVPFSGGPRGCLGAKYAMMSMKTLIATIVRNYKIYTEYEKVEDVKLKQDFLLKPVDGFKISFALRK